jgi:hypothetical protein
MVALTAIEEISYIADYKESVLLHLEELPPLLPPTRKIATSRFSMSILGLFRSHFKHVNVALRAPAASDVRELLRRNWLLRR